MLGLARRFGLDTVFILSSGRADVRLRYFVPDHEMGISGHATVAALTVQNRLGHLHPGRILVETSTGLFGATLSIDGPDPRVTLEQNKPIFGVSASRAVVASVLGIDISVITPGPIQSVSVSRPKLVVPLVSVAVLNNLSPRFEQLWDLCDRLEVSGFYRIRWLVGAAFRERPGPAVSGESGLSRGCGHWRGGGRSRRISCAL